VQVLSFFIYFSAQLFLSFLHFTVSSFGFFLISSFLLLHLFFSLVPNILSFLISDLLFFSSRSFFDSSLFLLFSAADLMGAAGGVGVGY
jgi:hypothetical protein